MGGSKIYFLNLSLKQLQQFGWRHIKTNNINGIFMEMSSGPSLKVGSYQFFWFPSWKKITWMNVGCCFSLKLKILLSNHDQVLIWKASSPISRKEWVASLHMYLTQLCWWPQIQIGTLVPTIHTWCVLTLLETLEALNWTKTSILIPLKTYVVGFIPR